MTSTFEDMVQIGFDGKPSLIVGKTPFRKSYALMMMSAEGNIMHTCAYFRSKEEATRFLYGLADIFQFPQRAAYVEYLDEHYANKELETKLQDERGVLDEGDDDV